MLLILLPRRIRPLSGRRRGKGVYVYDHGQRVRDCRRRAADGERKILQRQELAFQKRHRLSISEEIVTLMTAGWKF
jgi:hypothetical protein